MIRIVGIIAVIASHVSSDIIQNHQRAFPNQIRPLLASEFWTANIIDSLCRFAVPLFVMLSDALLLKPARIDALRFYRRRLSRILVPAIFWTSVGLIALLASENSAAVALLGFHGTIFGMFVPFLAYFLAGYLLKDVVLRLPWTLAAIVGLLLGWASVTMGTGLM